MSPNLYVIAGPNGAGKTTFAREFLPLYADCTEFINADLIAAGLSPLSPETAAFRAGRLMLREIERLAGRRITFGFESTLSGRAHVALIEGLKRRGYSTHFFVLWVPSVGLALSRVRGRVMAGGHDVPEPVVRRRFEKCFRNFFSLYARLSDSWTLFDNSDPFPRMIAFNKERSLHIIDGELYGVLSSKYGA